MNKTLIENNPVLKRMSEQEEVVWINPDAVPAKEALSAVGLSMKDIDDAEARLQRFAPFVLRCFPETKERGGIIESDLIRIPAMQKLLNEKYGAGLQGTLLLKKDSHLAIAGSVKARGGIYEVLRHTEDLALENGLLSEKDLLGGPGSEEAYRALGDDSAKSVFSRYKIQVGSTGNLGLSIGIMSAAIGYKAVVHMSADAKQWKKDLLRAHGVTVIEYEADYSEAVKNGRKQSDLDPMSYFVDDENSRELFLGYAVAAKRLVRQLEEKSIRVDKDHPLFVYIPCGVGGAPGGITFGLKQVFEDNVHCFFAEPVQAPCMLAGMASGLQSAVCVQDLGLTGQTQADGLAVGRASGFVGEVMKPLLDGEFTVRDERLFDLMRDLYFSENIFIEPSAAAAFMGVIRLFTSPETRQYIKDHGLIDKMNNAAHIVWATGGSLVPEKVRAEYLKTARKNRRETATVPVSIPCTVTCRNREGREIKAELRICSKEDLPEILRLQDHVLDRIEGDHKFVRTPEEEIVESLSEDYCIGAFSGGRLIMFTLMIRNRVTPRNLGTALEYSEEQLKKTVTYDTTFVDPDFRGYGLQELSIGLKDRKAREIGAAEALATVSPDNEYSLHNAETNKFRIAARKKMYGGFERFVLRKVFEEE